MHIKKILQFISLYANARAWTSKSRVIFYLELARWTIVGTFTVKNKIFCLLEKRIKRAETHKSFKNLNRKYKRHQRICIKFSSCGSRVFLPKINFEMRDVLQKNPYSVCHTDWNICLTMICIHLNVANIVLHFFSGISQS